MSELSSKFTREDIETLLEAMGDWEMVGNHEFHILQLIKSAPMPPQDHEAFEAMASIKEHFKKREKEIKRSRETKQEKAVFLKAKLMLVRREININDLFDMAANTDLNSPIPEVAPEVDEDDEEKLEEVAKAPKKFKTSRREPSADSDLQKKLGLAEYFIKDLGVWKNYTKFLKERSDDLNSLEASESDEASDEVENN